MLKKLVNVLLVVPLAVILIVMSVANRERVTLAFNPFQPDDSVLSLTAPFFVFLFLAVALGILIGSAATWFSQGKYRKRARHEARAATKWQAEADRHKKQVQSPSLPVDGMARLPSK